MAEFISKLQYKTYEKGEFSDEKIRSLEETIQLIKNFPWDEQRGVDIQLTGPSVTIKDDYGNYLKVGLYFNSKFCLYYLDNDGHLYEYHTNELGNINNWITDFFDQQLDLAQFEKHIFSVNSRSHFDTGSFEYSMNKTIMAFYLLMMLFFSFVAVVGTIAFFKIKDMPKPFILLFLFLDIIYLGTFYFVIKIYLKTKDMILYITRGKDDFQFWQDDFLEGYEKENIAALNIYGQTVRSSRIFSLMELVFKDGTNLIVPGTLIDPYTFALKFPNCSANYKGGYFLYTKIFRDYSK
jgi:hypothetical protein